MTEQQINQPMQQSNIFTAEVRGMQHTYYLTGVIGEPEKYVDLCNILRTSGPQDEVVIRINSRGGDISSERMIVNAIRESQALVKAFIEYDCMSAATGIFLAAHEHGWAEHIQFMAHCSWWASYGKNPDIKSQTEFGIRQMEEEIETTYSGLLSPEEIKQCNDGKEFWFNAKELERRMSDYYEYQAILAEEFEHGVDTEESFKHKTLESIIEESLETVLTRVLDERESKEKLAVQKSHKKQAAKPTLDELLRIKELPN